MSINSHDSPVDGYEKDAPSDEDNVEVVRVMDQCDTEKHEDYCLTSRRQQFQEIPERDRKE